MYLSLKHHLLLEKLHDLVVSFQRTKKLRQKLISHMEVSQLKIKQLLLAAWDNCRRNKHNYSNRPQPSKDSLIMNTKTNKILPWFPRRLNLNIHFTWTV
jgi:hypothetical protein